MKLDILVVEDSATQAEAVRSLLEEEYAVTVASSAEKAVEFLGEKRFHLVLSDIVMPGLSGYDLCRRIKAEPEWRETPVVLLTSLVDPLDIVRGLEAGADNYITKPFEAEHLLARIDHVLANRRIRQTSRTSMGVSVNFLGTELNITSDKEQILDLLLSSIEDIIRTNRALEESRVQLAAAHAELERYARAKEREAAVSAERYSTLMQQAGDAILVLNVDATIAEANARAADLLGYPAEEMIGRALEDFVVPEQRAAQRATLASLVRGADVASSEREFTRIDGAVVFCEGTQSIVDVGDGEKLILAIYRDVTARMQSEAKLRRQEMHLREAQDIARLGSWERDLDSGLVSFSEQYGAIFGFPPEKSVRPLDDMIALVHPDDLPRMLEAARRADEEGEAFEAEFRVLGQDGVMRVASVRGRPELDDHGRTTRVLGVIQDITEQRALERQLLQAQKMEAIGRLAGGIAHDFNNILMAIKGSLHFLAEDIGADHPSRPDVEDIESAAERAARLTRQLLAFSRQQVLQPQVVELSGIVREHERMLRRLLPDDVEIHMDIAPDLWSVTADPGQMEQILLNLVVNARDAMPGGGTVSISLSNTSVEPGSAGTAAGIDPGDYVLLSVSDNGEGIPDEVLEHIFEPFFTTKLDGGGTGLGLSTVYGIVQQSGGHILVEGHAGTGARFAVYLPRTASVPVEHDTSADAAPRPSVAGTILLVEDQPEVRRSLARVLRRQGHAVHEASAGQEALEIFKATPELDLIISDVVMPKMSGVELAERVHRERREIPILLMSGYLDDEVARRGLSRAGAQFIQKPFDHDALIRRISDILAGRPQRRRSRPG